MNTKSPKTLTTTGIGSLPHEDPAEAADFVLSEGPDVPFWPQLPRRSPMERMIEQYAAGMPCVRWDETRKKAVMDVSDKYAELEVFYGKYLSGDPDRFALPDDRAAGFSAFLEAVSKTNPPHALKGQITGPLTFTTGISDMEGNTLYGDPELRDAAVKLLERNACWQVRRLKEAGADRVLLFADEPVLAAYGSSSYVGISEADVTGMLSQIFTAVSEAGAIPGLHVCGNCDWSVAMRSGVKILNFDAYLYGTTLALYCGELQQFLDSGGFVAWGIVPSTGDIGEETAGSLAGRLANVLDKLESKGLDRADVLKRSLLTPSCGAGSISRQQASRVFAVLEELKGWLAGQATVNLTDHDE